MDQNRNFRGISRYKSEKIRVMSYVGKSAGTPKPAQFPFCGISGQKSAQPALLPGGAERRADKARASRPPGSADEGSKILLRTGGNGHGSSGALTAEWIVRARPDQPRSSQSSAGPNRGNHVRIVFGIGSGTAHPLPFIKSDLDHKAQENDYGHDGARSDLHCPASEIHP